ncbi:hypothetical protein B0H19DRAFT_1184879 [Mycena capillaripes]|nr:hypothetical protein B0H19DRAFT_1184879 [Mycena capillaripes]
MSPPCPVTSTGLSSRTCTPSARASPRYVSTRTLHPPWTRGSVLARRPSAHASTQDALSGSLLGVRRPRALHPPASLPRRDSHW